MFDNLKKYSEMDIFDKSKKIGLFVKEDSVSADIRLLTVFDELSSNDGFTSYIIGKEDLVQVEKNLLQNQFFFDYVVIQRNALHQNEIVESNLSKLLVDKCKNNGIKIIFEIDDDLLNMDKSNPGYNYYMRIKKDLEYVIKNSDVVTVSTDVLKDSLSYLNNNIVVIPNRLIELWTSNNNSNQKLREKNDIKIGYMGSVFHSWDLVILEDIIPSVKKYFKEKENKNLIFEIIGGTSDNLDWAKSIEIPKDKIRYVNFVQWLKEVVDWDIVVAPLEDSVLNNNKSELKYLEYTALGIPGIYSDIGPYKRTISDEYDGLLVKNNDSDEWKAKIIRLIKNYDLREKILNNARKEVLSSYLIKYSVDQWLSILNSLNLRYNINRRRLINYSVIDSFKTNYLDRNDILRILDVGVLNSYFNFKSIFDEDCWEYYGLDVKYNENADIIINNNYNWLNIKDNSFDVIVSAEFVENLDYFWIIFNHFKRIIKVGGYLCLIVSVDPILVENSNTYFGLREDGIKSLINSIDFDVDYFSIIDNSPWQDICIIAHKSLYC